jgi:hypothetical protein
VRLMSRPHMVSHFSKLSELAETYKVEKAAYLGPKIPNFCIRLVWNILNKFINCADFKFHTETELKILEQIQYLSL